ncbi:MAG: ABC transporter permease [Endomicrobium sp.]|jgi:spermidine/putrescine transport system permease protein|nr:ABC transporter permease [Endomicrobium sp.]
MNPFEKRSGRMAFAAVLPMYTFTFFFILGPLIYMLALSFMQREGAWGVSADWTIANYIKILNPLYISIFWSSLKLALISTVFAVLIGYPFGYYMSKLSPKWRNAAMIFLIIPFWTNALIRLYGWMIVFRANGILDKILMKLGFTQEPLRLLYSYPAVVVGMIYILVPFVIYAVYASAEKLDWKLIEAARDLGASHFCAFKSITLPLTMPGIFSGVILTFVPSMGLYFIAEILGGSKVVLIGNLVEEELMKAHDWPFAAALSVGLLLLTSFFLFAYKKLTKSAALEGLV